jgi:hemoglobin-like flavoprotein
MTSAQIQRIHHSWRLLKAVDPAIVGDVFYSRLFFLHPRLRGMFPKKMEEQHQKLIDMLSHMVARLDQPEQLAQEVQAMGARHLGYGVKPEHYAMVGDALLWTLEKGLGHDWTPETAEAWAACYDLIAGKMMEVTAG